MKKFSDLSQPQRDALVSMVLAGEPGAAHTLKLLTVAECNHRMANAKDSMLEAVKLVCDDTRRALTTKIPAGAAYGCGEMQRHRAHALPMQYFRKGGGC